MGIFWSGRACSRRYPALGGSLLGTFWALANAYGMVWIRVRVLWISALKPGKWPACQSTWRNCAAYRTDWLGVWIYLEPASSQSKGVDGERISNASGWRAVISGWVWIWRADHRN